MNILKQYTTQTNDATKVQLQPQIQLIPRKQIGGRLIQKFQLAGRIERTSPTFNYRTVLGTLFPEKNSSATTNIPGAGVRKIARRYNDAVKKSIPNSRYKIPVMESTQSYVGVPYASDEPDTHNPKRPFEIGEYGYTIFDENGGYTDYPIDKSTLTASTQATDQTNKPTGRRTNVSAVGTSTPAMTNAHLKARNNAIARGWRDYFYKGKRYSLKGSDLKQAQKNWNINRGRLPRKTQNSFNPGQVLQESVLNGNELKQEIVPIKADFGYGVTESDLKTQYPSTISDEIKNFRLEPIIQNQ